MSREKVEVVEAAYEAINRHDLEALLALCHPEVEYINAPDAAEPGVRVGHLGFRSAFQSLIDSFEGYRADPQQLLSAGNRVVAIERSSGRGKASGAAFEAIHGHVFTVVDGQIIRFEWFRTREEALEAVGLSE